MLRRCTRLLALRNTRSHIQSAGALIIGYVHPAHRIPADHTRDEILNGKTLDRNSNYFARFCFDHGIDLCAAPPHAGRR